MVSSSVLQCLFTIACLLLATQAKIPQSYRSLKTVIFNQGKSKALPEKCLPTCNDNNGTLLEGVHVRDPSSCYQYWVCLPDGTLYDQPHLCPPGEIVNTDDIVCETLIEGSYQCDIPDPDCDLRIPKVCYNQDTCPDPEDGLFAYPDETDCGKYRICNYNEAIVIECEAPLLYFDGQECVADSKRCCECQAVCHTSWTFIPDPVDCSSYYLCQDLEGSIELMDTPYIATDEEKFSCPGGEMFDASINQCSDSATCTPKANCL